MDQPEPKADPDTVEYTDPQDADEKDGIGIVAETQQPLSFILRQHTLLIKIGCGAGANRVSGNQPQKESTACLTRQTEQRRHDPTEQRGGPRAKAQRYQQRRCDHEGEKCGNDRAGAECQCGRCSSTQADGVGKEPDQNAAQRQNLKTMTEPFHEITETDYAQERKIIRIARPFADTAVCVSYVCTRNRQVFFRQRIWFSEVKKMERKRKDKAGTVLNAVAELFDLPADVVAGLPHLELIGDRQLYLEHHTGILSYSEAQIDANTAAGVLRVKGERLSLLAMTAEELRIGGMISGVEWVGVSEC